MAYLTVYISLLFLFIASLDKRNKEHRYTKLFLLIGLSFIFLLTSLRFEMGTDYGTYKYIFENIEPYFSIDVEKTINFLNFDTLQVLFVSLLKGLNNSSIFVFATYAFLSVFLLFRPIVNYSHYPLLSSLLFLNLYTLPLLFNGMSQGLVQAAFLYLLLTKNKRSRKQIFWLSLSALFLTFFHRTGLLIIPVFLIYKYVKVDTKTYLTVLVVVAVLKLFSLDIIVFESLLNYVFPEDLIKAMQFYNQRFEVPNTSIQIIYRLFLILPMFLSIRHIQNSLRFRQIFLLYFIGFVAFIIFDFLGLFMARINLFFRILEIFLIPYIIWVSPKHIKPLLFLYYIIITTFVLISNFSKTAYYPYKSIIELIF